MTHPDLSDAVLDELMRLREAGTAAQWRAERNIVHTDDGRSPRGELHTGSEADAKLIAAAVNALPALVKEVRELRRRVSVLTAANDMGDMNTGLAKRMIEDRDARLAAAESARDDLRTELENAVDRLASSDHVIREMQARERNMVADKLEAERGRDEWKRIAEDDNAAIHRAGAETRSKLRIAEAERDEARASNDAARECIRSEIATYGRLMGACTPQGTDWRRYRDIREVLIEVMVKARAALAKTEAR